MRFSRFEAIRYGRFADACLDFPASSPDFHVVYGPNEAGKSTLRSAIVDFLFGIPGQTAMNFRHPYDRMLLGASLERDGATAEWRRRKGNRGTLLDATGEPTDEGRLAEWLGRADRAFYERMFALDHEGLRRGGTAMLEERDDVGATLFEAASGAAGLHELRQAMGKEADELWKPRGSVNAFVKARERMRAAAEERRSHSVRVEDWLAAKDRLQAAEKAFREVAAEQERLEAEQRRLARIRAVAPHLLVRRHALAELDRLGPVPATPVGAARTLEEARQAIVAEEVHERSAGAEIKALENKRAELLLDEPALGRAEEIRALAERAPVVAKERADLLKRRDEAAESARRLRIGAERLGWPEADPDAIAARLPPSGSRDALEELARERGKLREAAESRQREAEKEQRALNEALSEADPAPEEEVAAEWAEALERARRLGDADARRRELDEQSDRARREFDAALAALAPWRGGESELHLPPPISAETAREWIARQKDLEVKLVQHAEAGARLRDELRRDLLEREQLRRDGAPVTAEEIAESRARRDGLWARIRSGDATPIAEYEAAVRAADELADRRFERAEAASKWPRLGVEIERLESELAAWAVRDADLRGELSAAEAEWREAAARLGDAAFRLTDYPEWLAARERAIERANAWREATAKADRFAALAAEALDALRDEWRRAVGEPERDEGDLAAWIRRTADEQRRRAESSQRRIDAAERARRLRPRADEAKQAAAAAARAWTGWQERWQTALAAAGLPVDSTPEAATAAIATIRALEAEASRLAEIRKRIAAIERDIDDFESDARRLADALGETEEADSGAAVAARLRARLEQAERTRADLARLDEQLRARHEERRQARVRRETAEARIAHLRAAAGVDDLDHLRDAVGRADEARTQRTRAEVAEEEAIRLGEGRDLPTLEAEFDAEDLDSLEQRLAAIDTQLREVQAERDARNDARTHAKRDLDAFDSGDAAARAEARRQEALADMTGAAARWAKLKTAERLLDWALNRFREERQGPLVGRASEIFAELTCGSFEALSVDYDDKGEPRLVGRRPRRPDETVNETVGVDGLSDGTRDQLFLALRLAAVELHLESAPPLPFLADDLFVHWDDERAVAGLRALAHLATRTHVLFFTHHSHLVELARRAIGATCPVVELGA